MRPLRPLVALLLCLAFSGPATAKDPEYDPHEQPRMFAVRDTSTVRNLVEEYRQMLEQKRIAVGLRTAQQVLDQHREDYFLIHEQDEQGWISTKASTLWRAAVEVVKDELAALPSAQRAAYEELAKPNAAPLLQLALTQRDPDKLREVLARFGASRAGIEAGRVLASLAIAEGRYRDGAWFAGEALRFAPTDKVLWQMRIDALEAAGDRRALEALVLPPDLTVPDGGGEDVAAHLAAAVERTAQPVPPRDRPVWGGDAGRTLPFPYESPVPRSLRWTEYTDFVERHRDQESPWYRESRAHPKFRAMLKNYRPTHPVVADRMVYAGDGRSLRAHDLYSGRTLWKFDASRYPGGRGAPFPMLNPGQSYAGRTSIERAFAPVVVGDLVITTIEERIPYIADKLQRIEISMYLPRRRLVACDRRTGELKWVFALRGLDRLRFGHYSIAGSPVESEGLILALGSSFEGSHNLVFFAVDAETGKLRWSRELGTGQQELNLFGVPVKELAASPVTVSDGVAYVSTGLGFVAALDVRTGTPRWLSSYEIIPIQAVDYWYRAPLRLPFVAASPPLAHKDVLVVAPTDGRHIYVFDKHTGRLRWRQPIVDTEASGRMDWDVFAHVLGIVNDGKRDVLITTDRRVVARHLFDDPSTRSVNEAGMLAWAGMEVPQIRGRGAIAGDSIVVPAEEGLFRYSIRAEGKQENEHVPWPGAAEPGNVFPLERVLIVAGRDNLQWFYDWEDLERDVAKRRRERPNDPSILLEAGELYLRAGDETERARSAFQEALRIAKRTSEAQDHAERARHGLYLSWLREGELNAGEMSKAVKAFEKSLEFAATPEERVAARMRLHEVLADAPTAQRKNLEELAGEAEDAVYTFDPEVGPVSARAHALLLWATARAADGDARGAVGLLQEAIRELGAEAYGSDTVRERAQRAIARLIADSGRSVYAEHERKARTLVDKARRTNDPVLLERVIREYPNADVLGDALLVRASQELAGGDADKAIELLRKVLGGHDDRSVAAPALALL
nr:PQQ-binding-like beta-propeller repeat protein [Planctomycetota bacterium]